MKILERTSKGSLGHNKVLVIALCLKRLLLLGCDDLFKSLHLRLRLILDTGLLGRVFDEARLGLNGDYLGFLSKILFRLLGQVVGLAVLLPIRFKLRLVKFLLTHVCLGLVHHKLWFVVT